MREITSYWFDVLREITSYWFDVQKRTNFKQLLCATCRFPHSYLTYVQFAAGIMSYFLFHGMKLKNILIISCLVSIVKYNNNNSNNNNNKKKKRSKNNKSPNNVWET